MLRGGAVRMRSWSGAHATGLPCCSPVRLLKRTKRSQQTGISGVCWFSKKWAPQLVAGSWSMAATFRRVGVPEFPSGDRPARIAGGGGVL